MIDCLVHLANNCLVSWLDVLLEIVVVVDVMLERLVHEDVVDILSLKDPLCIFVELF